MNIFKIIVGVILFTTLNIQAQSRSQAVFTECVYKDDPIGCTNEKFHTDITALLTPQITLELKKNLPEGHFTVSIILISDAEGKIIPAETRILCPLQLEKPVRDYISNLPVFMPKRRTLDGGRSVHIINSSFIYNNSINSYRTIEWDEMKALNLKSETLPLDSYPIYPGCEGFENDRELKCLSAAISKFIIKNYRVPDSEYYGKVKMMAHLIIEKDGSITIDKITGDEETFKKEAERVIMMVPKAQPGRISNIPVRVPCILPITINMG